MWKKKPTLFVIICLAVIAGLVSTAYFINRSKNQSSTKTTTDTHATEVNQPASKVADMNSTLPTATGTIITTGDSEFGTMLFNDKKQAIYIFQREVSAKADCYNDCAKAWPPVLTDGTPRVAGAVNSSLLGTIQRTDGGTQVTYNGHPLYYYAHEGPGEVKCHNVSSYGGLWWVIQPNGNRAV